MLPMHTVKLITRDYHEPATITWKGGPFPSKHAGAREARFYARKHKRRSRR